MIASIKTIGNRGSDFPGNNREYSTLHLPGDTGLSSYFLKTARTIQTKYYFSKLRLHSAIFLSDEKAGKRAVISYV